MWLIPVLLEQIRAFIMHSPFLIATKLHTVKERQHSQTLTYSSAYFMVYRFQFKFLLEHITPLIFDNANELRASRTTSFMTNEETVKYARICERRDKATRPNVPGGYYFDGNETKRV